MSVTGNLVDLVKQLVEAENQKDSATADFILAPSFTAITRSNGVEQNRKELLQEIANPGNPDIYREIEQDNFWTSSSQDFGVVKSVIKTVDRAKPEDTLGKFLNIHVFENREGHWRCLAWQVTKLQ